MSYIYVRNKGEYKGMHEKRVMIVDDDVGIVFLLKELLSSKGYGVSTASTGDETIKLMKEESYDLILMDFQLPMKNGLEVIAETSEIGINTPVIMMTGMPEKIETVVKEVDRIVGLLQKPFDIFNVMQLVEENMNS